VIRIRNRIIVFYLIKDYDLREVRLAAAAAEEED
jgi:hypothetical protein